MAVLDIFVAALLASSAVASPVLNERATNTNPTTTLVATATGKPGLNDAAKAHGKLWFGTAADIPGPETSDKYYMREFNNAHDFGEATPANIMKFEYTEPLQNGYNFTGGDDFIALAKSSGKLVRCHNLIWANQLPNWVTSPSKPWTNKTLSKVLKNHVTHLVEHFGDNCYSWDVVNEAFSDNPAGSYASNIWYNTIGAEYVPMAFAAAQKVIQERALSVKLYYNDYNIESPNNKTTAALNLVKELKGRGIQIDGVGLESHFIAGETPSLHAQIQTKKAFAKEGVDTAITELDVRLNLPPTLATEQQQVVDYYNSVKSCVKVKRCIGITVWDFDDTYSWIPGTFPGQGYGDLFLQKHGAGTRLTKKAAYDGCLEALTGAPEAP